MLYGFMVMALRPTQKQGFVDKIRADVSIYDFRGGYVSFFVSNLRDPISNN